MKYIVYTFITLLMLGAFVVDYHDDQNIYALRHASAAEQEPQRWQSGDTTWYEIDSVCPEEMDIKTQNGLVRHRFALVFGKRRINLYIHI